MELHNQSLENIMNRSRRHHYLPRNYLKGFVNSDERFYVYDKVKKEIYRRVSPGSQFFQNDLNTVTLPGGGKSDFIEVLYSLIEGQSWDSFDTIRNSTALTPIDPGDHGQLFLFLLILHWRLPQNLDEAAKYMEQVDVADTLIDFVNVDVEITGNAEASQAIEHVLKSSESFIKLGRLFVPFIPFYKDPHWYEKIMKWHFYYNTNNRHFMVGDTPFITNGEFDHDPIRCLDKFIFPVSSDILIVMNDGQGKKELSTEFIMQYNAAIFERSCRFVAHHDETQLRNQADYYEALCDCGKNSCIVSDVFDMIQA